MRDLKEEIFKTLEDSGDGELAILYKTVSEAFPSNEAHPADFGRKYINAEELKRYAHSRGWEVSLAKDIKQEDSHESPPVVFKRLA